MATYLKHVRSTWDTIDNHKAFRVHLDALTVQTLQGRYTSASEDYEFIYQRKDILFPRLESAAETHRFDGPYSLDPSRDTVASYVP